MSREETLETNLKNILEQIDKLSPSQNVKLIAVSKMKPVQDIQILGKLGQKFFGENKVQEAQEKKTHLNDELELHFIGHLQKNKAKYCPGVLDVIHSIDSLSTLTKLDQKYSERNKTLKYLVQMNLTDETTKSGLSNEDDLNRFLDQSLNYSAVTPIGLMTISNPNYSSSENRGTFSQLRILQEKTKALFKLENFSELSMGMSGDYAEAIQEGATYVRIGQAIFGEREYN